jgi:hypothetical protein
MTIRGDSFSSAAEVTAYTRHLLEGQSAFNSTTRPTVTELEKFIDRASGILNVAIASAGFSPSSVYANSTAKLACDDFVTMKAAKYVEMTQRGTGYSDADGSRLAAFEMKQSARQFIEEMALGFKRLGIGQNYRMGEGLQFTGATAQTDRADPDDTSLEQPKFKRGQWDNSE